MRLDGITKDVDSKSDDLVETDQKNPEEYSARFKASSFQLATGPAVPERQDGEPMDVASDVDGEPADIDGEPVDDVDGEPVDDVDGELVDDVDGEPIDMDSDPVGDDVDGVPVADIDIDGLPLDEVDGEAMNEDEA